MRASGEAATHLPWLTPGAAALVALARSAGAAAWPEIRTDPGAVLLVVRSATSDNGPPEPLVTPSLLQQAGLLEDALHHIDGPGADVVSGERADCLFVDQASLTYARVAATVAEHTGRCDPDCAWVGGLLAPLGWLALASADSAAVVACVSDPDWAANPDGVQRRLWGMDQASIARRLCRRWGVPPWLAAIIGHLDLAPGHATSLGASADLLRVVQLAVAVAQENGVRLSLATGDAAAGNAHALGLAGGDLDVVAAAARAAMAEDLPRRDPPPQPPLLRDLLRTAAELRRARENTVVGQLEREVDDLHAALRDQRATEDARLRTMKLSALAEFAAGASHEINNPLAVISGQAQYLLNQEPDPSRQRALHTIVGQARRVHQVLTELMQFARPPRPEIESVEASGLLADVTRSVSELAEQRRVRVECVPPNRPVFLRADPRQLHTALACILRNAVEAAPPDGWARLRLVEKGDAWEFAVEDNGGEPSPAQSEHLFDPFFSGRLAGRGRGLGLSTAWQLARGHGGDVRYDGHQAGVTRFVLTLPRTADVVPQSPDPAALAGPDGHHTSPVNGQLRVSCGP